MYLELQNLSIGYSKPLTETSIHAKFNCPQMCALFGNNGIGKTTLIKTLARLVLPLNGEILFNQKNISEISQTEFAKQFAFLFTKRPFLMNHTIQDIIALGRTPYVKWNGKLSDHDLQIIHYYAKILGIQDILAKPADEVSDGQFQKAMIAKTLAQQTPVIILDEPLSFLDYKTKTQILKTLKDIVCTENKIVILSSHDIHLCKEVADSVFLIHQKQWVYKPSEEIFSDTLFSDFFQTD
ncbi:MAG: ABC transporter ATP-binding protein [Bacteroidia bacterium]|nr:ABC transporter ATP-binding protein [Bacteroidia bacterium]